jgi:DNA-directed RNA polymerase subunit RPC12/RpoP
MFISYCYFIDVSGGIAMIEKYSRDYRCMRCGAHISSDELQIRGGVIKCYFCGYHVLKRDKPLTINEIQTVFIEPFNKLVDNELQQFIDRVGEVEVKRHETSFRLGKIRFTYPWTTLDVPSVIEDDGTIHEIYPSEACYRNITYALPISVEMTPVLNGKEHEMELVYMGNLPVMVKSKLCILSRLSTGESKREEEKDPGGYFIIEGVRRDVLPEYFAEMFKVSALKLLWKAKRRLEISKKHPRRLSSIIRPRIGEYIAALMKMLPVHVVRHDFYEEIISKPLVGYPTTLLLTQSLTYYAQELGKDNLCNVPYKVMRFF